MYPSILVLTLYGSVRLTESFLFVCLFVFLNVDRFITAIYQFSKQFYFSKQSFGFFVFLSFALLCLSFLLSIFPVFLSCYLAIHNYGVVDSVKKWHISPCLALLGMRWWNSVTSTNRHSLGNADISRAFTFLVRAILPAPNLGLVDLRAQIYLRNQTHSVSLCCRIIPIQYLLLSQKIQSFLFTVCRFFPFTITLIAF